MSKWSWGSLVLVVVGFFAYVILSSMAVAKVRCEVCMEFRGEVVCRTASGENREEAVQTAIDNACALLVSGVTDTLACTGKPPTSVDCSEN